MKGSRDGRNALPQEHLAKSFGVFRGDGEVHVRIRFLQPVTRYVEESTWHPSQKLTRQRDGSVIVEFTLDGTEEIKRWIMSFGKHGTVLELSSLRQEILAEMDAMAHPNKSATQQRKYRPRTK
jgi:proteasome accessory factor B